MSRVSPLRASVATGLTLGTAALGLALAPAAFAAELMAPNAPATAAVGEEFTVSGAGCLTAEDPAHPEYEAMVGVVTDPNLDNPEPYVFIADPSDTGDWSTSVSFPAGTTAGDHEVWAACFTTYAGEPTEYPPAMVTVTVPGDAVAPTTPTTPVATPTPGALRGVEANTPGVAPKTTDATTSTKSAPGQKVVRVLTGFQPWENVTVTLHSTPVVVGTFTADADGVVTVTFTVPEGTPVGSHDLVYEGDQGTYFQESFTVATASGASSAEGNLAYTGASVGLPLALGAGLLIAGGGALVVTRRRSAGAPQA